MLCLSHDPCENVLPSGLGANLAQLHVEMITLMCHVPPRRELWCNLISLSLGHYTKITKMYFSNLVQKNAPL